MGEVDEQVLDFFLFTLGEKDGRAILRGYQSRIKGEPDTVAYQIPDILHSVACPKYRL